MSKVKLSQALKEHKQGQKTSKLEPASEQTVEQKAEITVEMLLEDDGSKSNKIQVMMSNSLKKAFDAEKNVYQTDSCFARELLAEALIARMAKRKNN